MSALFVSTLATLFVVIDPVGCAPIYSSLTEGASAAQRRSMAVRTIAIAAGVLLVFAFFGKPLLAALGISLDAFRIAGGVMLFLIAAEMVFEKRTERRENRAQELVDAGRTGEVEDVSVFPMAIPMIAGPGSIASMMLLTSRATNWSERGVVLGALAIILAGTLLALLAADPLMRVLGRRLEAMLTRLLGVILAALAAQYVVDGIRASFNL